LLPRAAVRDGIGWLAPICFLALEVLRPVRVLPATVQPRLASLRDRLSNRWCDLRFRTLSLIHGLTTRQLGPARSLGWSHGRARV